MRTNKHAANCSRCRTWVAAQAGTLTGPPWRVFCADCEKAGAAADGGGAPKIEKKTSRLLRLTLADGGRVAVRPRGFLGIDLFELYRGACGRAGAAFAGRTVGNAIAVDGVPRLLEELEAAGFEVEADPAVAATLQAHAASIRAGVEATDERLDSIDARLSNLGLALFPFQREGVRWLAARKRGLLADSVGLGKTVQALAAIPDGAPVLVSAPAGVKGSWCAEVARWRPDFRASVLKGRKSFRWPEPGEVVITNPDILPDVPPPNCPRGLVLIPDEAHAFKNPKAIRTKRMTKIARVVRDAGGYNWPMTATPMLNRPPELRSVLQVFDLSGEAFGRKWSDFVELFRGRKGMWGGYEWGTPHPSVPERLRRVSLRREMETVLPDLPTLRYQDHPVDGLDAATRKLCDKVIAGLEEAGVTLEELAEAGKLAGAGIDFEVISAARAALAKAKIPAMLEFVVSFEEAEEPLVVCSAHRAPIDALEAREGWATITGSTPAERRTEIVEAFQAGELLGVALTIKAGGIGITLTHASHELFVDEEWTPALNFQMAGRIRRIGQAADAVLIHRLVADHVLERHVSKVLLQKLLLIDASVNASEVSAAPAPEMPDVAAVLDRVKITEPPKVRTRNERRAAETDEERTAIAHARRAEGDRFLTSILEDLDGDGLTEKQWAVLLRSASANGRLAKGTQERWAAAALVRLAALDPDRADELNGVGFNRLDGELGHKFSALAGDGGLTDRQWTAAIRMCRKYHRQVGACPPGLVS